jgi:hypothetical protein
MSAIAASPTTAISQQDPIQKKKKQRLVDDGDKNENRNGIGG